MRTTIALDDDVFELVTRQAKLRGLSLGKTVSDLVRRGLNAPTPSQEESGLVVFRLPADSPKVIEIDKGTWEKFTVIEAIRIMQRHNLPPNGGLESLKKALGYRLYAYLNKQEFVDETPTSFVFRMNECRVQVARARDGREPFPCKEVGIVEYSLFASMIDSRIRTECLGCPPDKKHPDYWCAWRFSI